MSDAPIVPAAPVATPVAPPAPSLADQVWAKLSGFYARWIDPVFAPVTSLFKPRAWWVYALFGLLAWFMVSVRGELKASLLSSVITLGTCYFGYVIAKVVSPEIKIGELYDEAKAGNVAAATVIVAALLQRVTYGVLCFIGAIYMIVSLADKAR